MEHQRMFVLLSAVPWEGVLTMDGDPLDMPESCGVAFMPVFESEEELKRAFPGMPYEEVGAVRASEVGGKLDA